MDHNPRLDSDLRMATGLPTSLGKSHAVKLGISSHGMQRNPPAMNPTQERAAVSNDIKGTFFESVAQPQLQRPVHMKSTVTFRQANSKPYRGSPPSRGSPLLSPLKEGLSTYMAPPPLVPVNAGVRPQTSGRV